MRQAIQMKLTNLKSCACKFIDVILYYLNLRSCDLKSVADEFNFLISKSLKVISAEDIKLAV